MRRPARSPSGRSGRTPAARGTRWAVCPGEVRAGALLRNQRDKLIAGARFQMKTGLWAFIGKVLSPARLLRFAENPAATTARLHARGGG